LPIWLVYIRATSHTRLKARDHYIWSTLIGGKGGAGPNSLHSTLEGPTENVKARWMWSLHGFLDGSKWIMFRGHLDYFQIPPFEGRSNTKLGEHGIPNIHNHWFILFYHVWGPVWIEIYWNNMWLRAWSHVTSHYTWGSVTTLHDFWGAFGHFLFGSHNFMFTALGLCVKWPLVLEWYHFPSSS
jgi:hypothetical protein